MRLNYDTTGSIFGIEYLAGSHKITFAPKEWAKFFDWAQANCRDEQHHEELMAFYAQTGEYPTEFLNWLEVEEGH